MPQLVFLAFPLVLLVAAIALLLAIALWLLFTPKRKRYIPKRIWCKQKNIITADTVLAKLHQIIEENPQPLPFVLAYLRKIDPFVFEELLLTCFERQGFTIRRNERYTGDGGLDGRVWLHGELYLIQAKRYKDSINPVHLEEFGRLIQSRGAAGGYFVHTGRTGDKALAKNKSAQPSLSPSRRKRLNLSVLPKILLIRLG
jgi:restriction system protein